MAQPQVYVPNLTVIRHPNDSSTNPPIDPFFSSIQKSTLGLEITSETLPTLWILTLSSCID